jgi:hypothetical protein
MDGSEKDSDGSETGLGCHILGSVPQIILSHKAEARRLLSDVLHPRNPLVKQARHTSVVAQLARYPIRRPRVVVSTNHLASSTAPTREDLPVGTRLRLHR